MTSPAPVRRAATRGRIVKIQTRPEQEAGQEMQVFVARQPIVNRQKLAFGYELLYRSTADNHFNHAEADESTMRVMANTLHVIGCEAGDSAQKTFINLPRNVLLNEDFRVMPPESTVLELLESVAPDQDVLKACQRLKRHGYQLALDDFTYSPQFEPFLDFADFVKIDFRATDNEERRNLVKRLKLRNTKLLAEKVETHEEFREATELGFAYFQGFFIARPEIVSGRDIPVQQHNSLRLIQLVNEPVLQYEIIERAIEQEPSLAVKLLRYINSTQFGVRHDIKSIKQALTLLGEVVVRKWITLAVIGTVCENRLNPLVPITLTRARFCELMAADMQQRGRELEMFMLGLLAGIDAIFNHPLDELLIQLPIARDLKVGLRGGTSPLGRLRTLLFQLETGDWPKVTATIDGLALDKDRVAQYWQSSLKWANQMTHG